MDSAYLRLRAAWSSAGYGPGLDVQARRILERSAPLGRKPTSEEEWRYTEGVSHIARACESYLESTEWSGRAISIRDGRPLRLEQRLKSMARSAAELKAQLAGTIADINRLVEHNHPTQARKLAYILNMIHAALLGVVHIEFDGNDSGPATIDELEPRYYRLEPRKRPGVVDLGVPPTDFINELNAGLELSEDGAIGLIHLQSVVEMATALLDDITLDPHVDATKAGPGRPRYASRNDFVVDLAIGFELVWRERAEASSYEKAGGIEQTCFARLVERAFVELRLLSPVVTITGLTNRAIDAAVDRARDASGELVFHKSDGM